MDEAALIEKLRLIEALHTGAATDGERVAAEQAKQRILKRLADCERDDPPIEVKFTMRDMWSKRVFLALLRRYGITPYRYKRQRHTTILARVSRRFVDETLWPEFVDLVTTLESYLSEVTDRVVARVIHKDSSDASVVAEPPRLSGGPGS